MEMAKVTSKGQITIPVSIRRRLKINEGDKLLFIDQPGGVMMVNPDLLGTTQGHVTEAVTVETAANVESVSDAAPTMPEKNNTNELQASKPPEEKHDIQKTSPEVAPAEITKPSPPDRTERKSSAKVGNLDLDSLLDEIRSIGRKI